MTGLIRWLENRKRIAWEFRAGRFTIVLDAGWLLIAPLTLWAVAAVYVPVMGAGLNAWQAWVVSIIILALILVSLLLHSLAHTGVARATGKRYRRLFVSLLGDPAHFWPAASSSAKEAIIALAGPIAQLILAALCYAIWNLQINTYFNVITFFLVFFNLALMAFNLIPAFPFDGGRLVRAVVWATLQRPAYGTRLAYRLTSVIAAGLVIWGIYLAVQRERFSLETAATVFIFVIIMIFSLVFQQKWKWDRPEQTTHLKSPATAFRVFLAVLLLLPLGAVTFCLVPVNQGIEMPGFTAAVGPMIQLPPQYSYSSTGSLILVTVIPQTPILAGEWVYAHLDHSVKLEPAEQIVPRDKTAQSVSLESYQQLLDSQTTAIIVGLRLAGYTVDFNNDGVTITEVLSTSPSSGVLQPGDIITGINGITVNTAADLTAQLKTLTAGSVIDLEIMRDGQKINVSVPTMEPAEEGGTVRIGIGIIQHTSGVNLPFPVEIVPQKVDGGPSAGLMFTLGVYDAVTDFDLTGGRKIAGTGTIDLAGNVGPIGGVQQKVVAAERAGAEYFLCPPDNYADALAMAGNIKVISVATAQEAIDFLRGLTS